MEVPSFARWVPFPSLEVPSFGRWVPFPSLEVPSFARWVPPQVWGDHLLPETLHPKLGLTIFCPKSFTPDLGWPLSARNPSPQVWGDHLLPETPHPRLGKGPARGVAPRKRGVGIIFLAPAATAGTFAASPRAASGLPPVIFSGACNERLPRPVPQPNHPNPISHRHTF
jgi:hypothetical protein